jgi:hypothetical protein
MSAMPNTSPLARVYIQALCGRAVYIYSGLDGRAAYFGFKEFERQKPWAKLWFARAAHAELVCLRCLQDFRSIGAMRKAGWVDLPPQEVGDKVKSTAALLGAKWQTQNQIERDAERVVAQITHRIKEAQMSGDLKEVNYSYKKYREEQLAKGETAIPYTAYLQHFTRDLVLRAAQKMM